MRFFELTSNLRMPASNEESDLINRIQESEIFDTDLNYREQELARKMVSRGLLERKVIDNTVKYMFNGYNNIKKDE